MTLALRTRGTSLAARGGSEGEGRERTGVWGAWWEEGGAGSDSPDICCRVYAKHKDTNRQDKETKVTVSKQRSRKYHRERSRRRAGAAQTSRRQEGEVLAGEGQGGGTRGIPHTPSGY